jgi:hypothetical protein
MSAEIVTVEDLEKFRIRLLADLVRMLEKPVSERPKGPEPLLRSGEVRKLLNVSPGTLQNLRIKGILPYTKLDGSFRYSQEDVFKALESLKHS